MNEAIAELGRDEDCFESTPFALEPGRGPTRTSHGTEEDAVLLVLGGGHWSPGLKEFLSMKALKHWVGEISFEGRIDEYEVVAQDKIEARGLLVRHLVRFFA
ncbi:MAG TPA: hypothetical protein VJY34_01400 [Roseiarcus sp.]|nr:hypothetical protein [Roseiarcus sp.]